MGDSHKGDNHYGYAEDKRDDGFDSIGKTLGSVG